ncbi:MAG: efflux RND transporter permease subunit [Chromatiales bacterium]|nr:efflux RND transporter permease subunit [Gammaproteobacteria bacterium]MBW6477247.1 efflux RND transporter permease subunit [Chromatiales bacterium]
MNLPQLSINRHVLAYMMSAVLVLFGLVSMDRLGVDRFPVIDFPAVSVTTVLPGANPEVIDASVTSVIESAINSVPGIDSVISNSVPGVSVVALTFNLNKDIDVAFNEVQAKVNQILRQLPVDADPPVVAKIQTDASPIMWIALQGDRTQQQLNQYANNVVRKSLETIDGVGEVRMGGRRDRTIRVELSPSRLAAQQLTVQDVIGAFQREHIQLPGGYLSGGNTERLLKLDMEFHSAEALKGLVLAQHNGNLVRLGDVAEVRDDLADFRRLARFNGEPTIGLGIVKVPGANTIAIASAVKERLANEIEPQLPPGLRVTMASDQSVFILDMIYALLDKIVLGTLLAALVVLVFLKNFRATLIISVAIPVSLLGAVAVMFMFGFTFNTLTLLALLLLIGVVVDDAIVVLENIYRHRETIEPDPIQAAMSGTRQVLFAVLATTLSLVAIFAPVIFMGGIIGRFFESFAVVVSVGVLISYFVAVTLTPMLCSRYLKVEHQHGHIYALFERMFQAMDRAYKAALHAVLAHRWKVVLATIVVVVVSTWSSMANIGFGFAPEEDEGQFLIIMRTPLGSGIEYTDQKLRQVEAILDRQEAVASYFTAIGLGDRGQANQAFAFVRMHPRGERDITQQQLVPIINREMSGIAGARGFATAVPMIAGQRGDPLQFVVRGPDLNQVAELSQRIEQRLNGLDGLGRIDLDLQLNLPQLELRIDRDRAAVLGLSSSEVAMAANVLSGGLNVAKYNDEPGDGERYDIRLKAADGEMTRSEDLGRIFLRNSAGELVRLDTVAGFEETIGPAVISRFNLQYAASFYATPSIPLGDAVNIVEQVAAEELPLGYSLRLQGEAEEMEKTAGYVGFVFLLATVLVYMVLASQFNSFIQPLIIMLAQPLAIIGGLLALWWTGSTLNIFSMIGMILLIGLVSKNSILLVDLTNQYRANGMGIDEALKEACPLRMRPVVMTSLTLILALMPAATGWGAGADTVGPLAVAVIGGMISSTVLALLVVPVVYSLIENALEGRRKKS